MNNAYIPNSNNVPTKAEQALRNEERLQKLSEIKRSLYQPAFWVPKKSRK